MRSRVIALLCALSLAGIATAETKWDLPTGYAPGNFHTKNVVAFADRVQAATGGKLVINVHPNASLYKANEIKRAVQTGQVQVGEVLMVLLANEHPIYSVDGIPFLATNYSEARRLSDLQRLYVEKILDEQGMKLLYMVPWPPQGLHVVKPVERVADLAGLPYRAYSKQTTRLGELAGTRPVTVQAAEVTQALATGKVNTFFASAQSGVDYKVWESIKYFYDAQGWLPKNMVVVSRKSFDALGPAVQAAVLTEARRAEEEGWKASAATAEETKATLTANGTQVLQPSPQLTADFRKIGEIMIAEWLRDAGPEGQALVDAFRR